MIHYHGTPLTPRAKLLPLAGKHFCVSYAEPRDADVCMDIGQSVLWDNGAFTAFTQGRTVDWNDYYAWLEPRLGHPHWAIIPDVIDGTIEQQQDLLRRWPFKHFGAPVWHMGLDVIYLLGLCEKWPKVCFGSTAQYWKVGSDLWRRRADEAFNELAKRHQRLPWIHMLRGMALRGSQYPFASVDSANVARNYATAKRDPEIMAREIDSIQCPIRWQEQPTQLEMIA